MIIQLVEDDEFLGKMVSLLLSETGYEVEIYSCCRDFRNRRGEGDVYILDIQLPDGSGMDLCEEIRRRSDAPILILTGTSAEESVVQALNAGADDYVIKPFRGKELAARIGALLRRRPVIMEAEEVRSVVLRPAEGELSYQGQRIRLTTGEIKLLAELVRHADKRVSREYLLNAMDQLHGDMVGDNALSVTVSRLRKKLRPYGWEDAIETCWGGGYRWRSEVVSVRMEP